MAQDKIRTTKKGVVIQPEEYKVYQKIRRNRASTIRKAREDFKKSLNLSYSSTLFPERKNERQGKRFTINNFRSRADFDQFMKYGERYSNFEEYKEKRARDYYYNMEEAFKKLSDEDPDIMQRFKNITKKLNDDYFILDEIYSQTEELDLSFVYNEVRQGNYERLNYTLDVLEKKIDYKLDKE